MAAPKARIIRSGRRRVMKLRPFRAIAMTRPLRALCFRFPTLEILEDGCPVAALAKKPLDGLAKRTLTATALQLPIRSVENFRRGVGRSGRDSGARHRGEIRKIVAEVKDLIEAEHQLLDQLLAGVQLVCRSLMQFRDSELARAAHEGRGAAAGQQRDRDADLLRELRCQAVADVELLDFAGLTGVDDFSVRPYPVDVGDDQA